MTELGIEIQFRSGAGYTVIKLQVASYKLQVKA